MTEPRVIKKYSNRRLYDTTSSKYITAEGVRKLVVEGHAVQVIDDTTGDDMTRSLLLQIIADQEQAGRPLLDTDMLMTIIRFYGHPMQELMGAYLGTAANNFVNQQSNMQEQLQAMLDPSKSADMLQQMAESNLQTWQNMQNAFMSPFTGQTKQKPSKDGQDSGKE